MFDDDFFDTLPDDPDEAALKICKKFLEINTEISGTEAVNDKYNNYLLAYAAMEVFCKAHSIEPGYVEIKGARHENVEAITRFFRSIEYVLERKAAQNVVESARDRYGRKFKQVFAYEFSDDDLKRIQDIVNELRDLISESELFDEEHRYRVLKKLEALQRELHKRVSSLDRFWGLVMEAAVMLGKAGTEAKPLVDLIRELAQIILQTQAMAEGLPSATPFPMLLGQTYPADQEQPELSTGSDN